MKTQLRYSDLVTVVALAVAGLTLVLALLLLSNSLNQSSQRQQIVLRQELQTQINNLRSVEIQVNSSLLSLETQWNKTSSEFTSTNQHQRDILMGELQTLRQHQNSTSQQIGTFNLQQTNLIQEIEISKSKLQQLTDNVTNMIGVRLSILEQNVSSNANDLVEIASSILMINETINDPNRVPIVNPITTTTPPASCSQGTFSQPATSCGDICPGYPSGSYWIRRGSFSSVELVYCDMNRQSCSCGTNQGWMRVANIDMTDFRQRCPSGYRLITSPRRSCGRSGLSSGGCVSTTFATHGVQYSRVCGRIIGYQIGSPSGIGFTTTSINSHYLAGYSITHGTPRTHIWSFANARGEGFRDTQECPCITGSNSVVPSFVRNDYFCDTAIRDTNVTDGVFYPNDPLWDGQGCGSRSTCCQLNNPPWFCRQLSRPTTDNIELRLCENSGPNDDDSPFEIIELYVN